MKYITKKLDFSNQTLEEMSLNSKKFYNLIKKRRIANFPYPDSQGIPKQSITAETPLPPRTREKPTLAAERDRANV